MFFSLNIYTDYHRTTSVMVQLCSWYTWYEELLNYDLYILCVIKDIYNGSFSYMASNLEQTTYVLMWKNLQLLIQLNNIISIQIG